MIKTLSILAILALVIYSVALIITPYYHYHAFKSDLEEILQVSVTDRPEEVMTKILTIVEQYSIPVEKKDIHLSMNKKYEAEVSWQETIVFYPFYKIYQKTFEFHIDTSK